MAYYALIIVHGKWRIGDTNYISVYSREYREKKHAAHQAWWDSLSEKEKETYKQEEERKRARDQHEQERKKKEAVLFLAQTTAMLSCFTTHRW